MKTNTPIDIDLLTFFKTGKFDFIKIGQTTDWIKNNFADPDSCNFIDNKNNIEIWSYGNIEFHFVHKVLNLIYSDFMPEIYGGENLKLNKWILSQSKRLTLKFVIDNLNIEKIDFQLENDKTLKNYTRIKLTESKIQLTFVGEDKLDINRINTNLFKLVSFSLLENKIE